MSNKTATETLSTNDIHAESTGIDDNDDNLVADPATNNPTRRQKPIAKGRRWLRSRPNAAAQTPSSEITTKTNDLDNSEATSPEHDGALAEVSDDGSGRSRRPARLRMLAFVVLPALAMVLTAGIAYLKYIHAEELASAQAATQSAQAAKDSTIAMLSYTPDTVDKKLTDATDRMTGGFRDSYSSLIHEVVIPGAKEKKISAVATVPAVASTSATPDHAVVLVFVDQAITMGDDAPTQTNSIVQVTLDRVHNRWLVSAFDPK